MYILYIGKILRSHKNSAPLFRFINLSKDKHCIPRQNLKMSYDSLENNPLCWIFNAVRWQKDYTVYHKVLLS